MRSVPYPAIRDDIQMSFASEGRWLSRLGLEVRTFIAWIRQRQAEKACAEQGHAVDPEGENTLWCDRCGRCLEEY